MVTPTAIDRRITMARTRTSTLRGTAPPPPADAGPAEPARPAGSRGPRIAFRVVAALTSIWVLGLAIFALLEVVMMWLPYDTLVAVVGADDLPANIEAHRGHFNGAGIIAWALVSAVLVQLRRPERRAAAMLQALGIVTASAVLYGLTGTFTDWLLEEITVLVPVALMAVLHPRARDLLRVPALDRPMGLLVAVAAVPWSVSIVHHAALQWRNLPGDPHAAMEHWAQAAVLGVVVLWCCLLGASDHAGWRLPAAVAVLASIDYGAFSLAFPDTASAAHPLLAVGAIVWGVAYGVLARRRAANVARDDGRQLTRVG
jgi:hypothetical protein